MSTYTFGRMQDCIGTSHLKRLRFVLFSDSGHRPLECRAHKLQKFDPCRTNLTRKPHLQPLTSTSPS